MSDHFDFNLSFLERDTMINGVKYSYQQKGSGKGGQRAPPLDPFSFTLKDIKAVIEKGKSDINNNTTQ
jgi:hypothetical protein